MDTEPPITIEQIRARAHELWDRNHRPDGYEVAFWLMAERELKAERAARSAAAPSGRGRDDLPGVAPRDEDA